MSLNFSLLFSSVDMEQPEMSHSSSPSRHASSQAVSLPANEWPEEVPENSSPHMDVALPLRLSKANLELHERHPERNAVNFQRSNFILQEMIARMETGRYRVDDFEVLVWLSRNQPDADRHPSLVCPKTSTSSDLVGSEEPGKDSDHGAEQLGNTTLSQAFADVAARQGSEHQQNQEHQGNPPPRQDLTQKLPTDSGPFPFTIEAHGDETVQKTGKPQFCLPRSLCRARGYIGLSMGLSRMTRLLVVSLIFCVIATLSLLITSIQDVSWSVSRISHGITSEFGHASARFPDQAISSNIVPDHRIPDTLDTFSNYRYRNHTKCTISSLDLHRPFHPLCSTRTEMLRAVSGGGRVGKEAPFMPRDCDMRWFSTEEICQIFGKFEKVIVIGDSMMRHVVGGMNVLLRKDLGYGAVTDWNFSPRERKECFCNKQFDVKECSLQGIYRTSDVERNDPDSLACGVQTMDLVIEVMLKFPLDPVEVDRFKALLSPTKPSKPYAFLFGHGLWNDLDVQATVNWLDGITSHTLAAAPYLGDAGAVWPRLFVSPNAAGPLKPDQWLVTQGDKALQIFEESTREEAMERGLEHLGTWNMSIQANKFDGVHLDLRGNLVKAMAAINWLAMLDVN